MKAGYIVLIVLGVLVVLAVIAAIIYFVIFRKKPNPTEKSVEDGLNNTEEIQP